MNDKISALMDNELGRREAFKMLDIIEKDLQEQQRWSRYHLYGAVMREELPSAIAPDFHERVAAVIAQEPVQLAPAAMQVDRSWRKPAFGLAVAASLLAVVIIVQKPFSTGPGPAPVSVAKHTPATIPQVGSQLIVANRNNENVRERINRLLVEHNEYNPASDMTGMMPYARFVDYSITSGKKE